MKIAVVGSINMDQVVLANKIPQKGETLMGNELMYVPGVKGANQAVAMARLGGIVKMYGLVGNDENGRKLLANLQKENVDVSNVKQGEKNTGLAIITVADNDNSIIVIPGANNEVDVAYIESVKTDLLENDIVVLQHEIPLETIEYIVDLFALHHKLIVLNPAPAKKIKPEILAKVTYLTPNEHELKTLFEFAKEDEIISKYQGKLIVTLGAKGLKYYENGKVQTIAARQSKIVDTTGAGDTFNGAMVVALSYNYPLTKALKFANIAAGLACEKLGAQSGMPSLAMVRKELEDEKKWNVK